MAARTFGSPFPPNDISKESSQRSSSALAQHCGYIDITSQYSYLTRRHNAYRGGMVKSAVCSVEDSNEAYL